MSVHPDDLHRVIRDIEFEVKAITGGLNRLKTMLSALNIPVPKQHLCPRCGIDTPNEDALLWHLVNVHSDPQAAEKLGVVA